MLAKLPFLFWLYTFGGVQMNGTRGQALEISVKCGTQRGRVNVAVLSRLLH